MDQYYQELAGDNTTDLPTLPDDTEDTTAFAEPGVVNDFLKLIKDFPQDQLALVGSAVNLAIVCPTIFKSGINEHLPQITAIARKPCVSLFQICANLSGGAAVMRHRGTFILYAPEAGVLAVTLGAPAEYLVAAELTTRFAKFKKFYRLPASDLAGSSKVTEDDTTLVQFAAQTDKELRALKPMQSLDCSAASINGKPLPPQAYHGFAAAIRKPAACHIILPAAYGDISIGGVSVVLGEQLPRGYGFQSEMDQGIIAEFVKRIPDVCFSTQPSAVSTDQTDAANADIKVLKYISAIGDDDAASVASNEDCPILDGVLTLYSEFRAVHGNNSNFAQSFFPEAAMYFNGPKVSKTSRKSISSTVTSCYGLSLETVLKAFSKFAWFKSAPDRTQLAALLLTRTNTLEIDDCPSHTLINTLAVGTAL